MPKQLWERKLWMSEVPTQAAWQCHQRNSSCVKHVVRKELLSQKQQQCCKVYLGVQMPRKKIPLQGL